MLSIMCMESYLAGPELKENGWVLEQLGLVLFLHIQAGHRERNNFQKAVTN